MVKYQPFYYKRINYKIKNSQVLTYFVGIKKEEEILEVLRLSKHNHKN